MLKIFFDNPYHSYYIMILASIIDLQPNWPIVFINLFFLMIFKEKSVFLNSDKLKLP